MTAVAAPTPAPEPVLTPVLDTDPARPAKLAELKRRLDSLASAFGVRDPAPGPSRLIALLKRCRAVAAEVVAVEDDADPDFGPSPASEDVYRTLHTALSPHLDDLAVQGLRRAKAQECERLTRRLAQIELDVQNLTAAAERGDTLGRRVDRVAGAPTSTEELAHRRQPLETEAEQIRDRLAEAADLDTLAVETTGRLVSALFPDAQDLATRLSDASKLAGEYWTADPRYRDLQAREDRMVELAEQLLRLGVPLDRAPDQPETSTAGSIARERGTVALELDQVRRDVRDRQEGHWLAVGREAIAGQEIARAECERLSQSQPRPFPPQAVATLHAACFERTSEAWELLEWLDNEPELSTAWTRRREADRERREARNPRRHVR